MSVYKYRWLILVNNFFGIYYRMAFCGKYFCVIHTGFLKAQAHSFGAFDHIVFMFAACAYGRNAQQLEEFVEEFFFVVFKVVFPGVHIVCLMLKFVFGKRQTAVVSRQL